MVWHSPSQRRPEAWNKRREFGNGTRSFIEREPLFDPFLALADNFVPAPGEAVRAVAAVCVALVAAVGTTQTGRSVADPPEKEKRGI